MGNGPAPLPSAVRMLRSGLFTATSSALAIAAHGLAGGSLADIPAVLPLSGVIALAGVGFAGRRIPRSAVFAALSVSELGQHMLLDLAHHGSASQLSHFSDAAMFLAHAIAVLITASVLTRTDSMVLAAVAVLRKLLPTTRFHRAADSSDHQTQIPLTARWYPTETAFLKTTTERGPPISS